jgi:membrane associated rhomboid family serine protease
MIVAIWALLWLTGLNDAAISAAGFVPARMAVVADQYAAASWAVPALLTPISSVFVHSGLWHVGFNLLMLLFCGRHVEYLLGRAAMLLIAAVGAYGAAAGQWLVDPASPIPIVGASGAISALFGCYAMLFQQQRTASWGPFPGYVVRMAGLLAGWTVIQLMLGLLSTGPYLIAVFAHIGGFATGLLLARPLLQWRFRSA